MFQNLKQPETVIEGDVEHHHITIAGDSWTANASDIVEKAPRACHVLDKTPPE